MTAIFAVPLACGRCGRNLKWNGFAGVASVVGCGHEVRE